jgi:hypothetical protein
VPVQVVLVLAYMQMTVEGETSAMRKGTHRSQEFVFLQRDANGGRADGGGKQAGNRAVHPGADPATQADRTQQGGKSRAGEQNHTTDFR